MPRPSTTLSDALQATLDALERQIEQGSENFLKAPANVADRLAKKLEQWQAEKKRLEGELSALQHGEKDETAKGETLREAYAQWCEVRSKLVEVKTGEVVTVESEWLGSLAVEVVAPMKCATLRQLLHDLDAKVWLWFTKRIDKKGWAIDRGRFKVEMKSKHSFGFASTEAK